MWIQIAEYILLAVAMVEVLAGAFLFLLQTNWMKPLAVGLVCVLVLLFFMIWRPMFWIRLALDLIIFFTLIWGFQLSEQDR